MPDRKTPREILTAAGKLDKDVVAVRYGNRIFDLHTPVSSGVDTGEVSSGFSGTREPTASDFKLIRATDAEGLAVIRHSSAHVMADAVQRLFLARR